MMGVPAEATTVFIARKVITMDPDMPDASAVAVRGGRIVAVGDAAELRRIGSVDDTFSE